MSAKTLDAHGRWRNIDVSFRVSPEESKLINELVAISGLTKRAYISKKLLNQDIVVVGNPKVYRALKHQMEQLYLEFQRLCSASEISPETLDILRFTSSVYEGMKHDENIL